MPASPAIYAQAPTRNYALHYLALVLRGALGENQRKKVRTSLLGWPPSCTSAPSSSQPHVHYRPHPRRPVKSTPPHAVASSYPPSRTTMHPHPSSPVRAFVHSAANARAPTPALAPAPAPRRVGSGSRTPPRTRTHPRHRLGACHMNSACSGRAYLRMSCASVSASSPLARQLRPFPALTLAAAPAHAPPLYR
ncbi:hypothetical protein B0H16DRAFT_1518431 [Mycena metata]|uniref:Uncharacterized protein n=1 Tax=Mycena metata TaxID=1033252 RepID=A0AAD7JPA2_9AGAR|nr:hypothetical protein B0H16DRAFT_1518431 [Mycena metata]